MKAFSLAILVLLVTGLSYAQSNQSLRDKPDKSAEPKKNTYTHERGTKDFPVVIEIQPSAPLKIETDHDNEQEQQKAVNEGRIAIGTIGIAVFTFFLAGVTGGLAVFTFKLWKSTNQLVIGAEKTAQKQLRAYVMIDKAQIVGLGDGQTPVAHLVIKNAGQTPAYHLTGIGGIAMGISWEALQPSTQNGPLQMTHASLGPNCITEQFYPAPRQLHCGENADLLNGSKTIFVYGEMHYRDTFDIDHFIEYRFQVGGSVGIRGNQLAICQEGNDET